MIKDTAYNLEVHLQRIDEKLVYMTTDGAADSVAIADLQDEREVTKHCLLVCNDVRARVESLQIDQRPSLQGAPYTGTVVSVKDHSEAQFIAYKMLKKRQKKLADTMSRLQQRLSFITSADTPRRDHEISQLEEDINISRQCSEICNKASDQASDQKINLIGERIADDDTD